MGEHYFGYIAQRHKRGELRQSFLDKMGIKILPNDLEKWQDISTDCIRVIKYKEIFFGGELVELVEVVKDAIDLSVLLKKYESKGNKNIVVYDLPKKIAEKTNIGFLSTSF
jgi:hypothetical protein